MREPSQNVTIMFRRLLSTWGALAALVGIGGCEGPATTRTEAVESEALGGGTVAFVDVTEASGLARFRHATGAFGKIWFPETVGGGGSFLDFDGDGWQDVLLVGGGSFRDVASTTDTPAVYLYRNQGDGTFEDVTDAVGLGDVAAYGFGATVGDYDNDGDPDVFLTTLYENLLFRNDADAAAPLGRRFAEVGRHAGLADHAAWSTASIFFDADRDGFLDLYVGNYVHWSPETDIWCTMDGSTKAYCTPQTYTGFPGRFYRNNGDGTFSERTQAAGFGEAPGKTLGITELDFNADGWPDLVIANDTQRDLLYENNGDGTFTERGIASGIAFDENGRARAGMGIDAGDVDGDGEPTVVIGHFANEMLGVYRHVGNGLFIDRGAPSQIGRPSLPTLTFGLFLFDADLDGDLDVFLANGHISEDVERTQADIGYRQAAQLFENLGDGTFREIGASTGGAFTQKMVARGTAHADYDRDGDLDVLVVENGGPAHLWQNQLMEAAAVSAPNVLRVRARGTASNRSGFGTRLEAAVGSKRIVRRVRSGGSFLAQSEQVVTFGLGDAAQVDSLIVYWPSGHVDRLGPIPAGEEIEIVEAQTVVEFAERAVAPTVER